MLKSRALHLFLAVTLIYSCVAFAAPQHDLSAAEILDQVAKVYTQCRSYIDTGVVTTVFRKPFKHTDKKPFQTAFVRPDRFRFEYRDRFMFTESNYIIWQDGDDISTWWNLHHPNVQKPAALVDAVGAATGVSGTSSINIPALLLPDRIKGPSLTKSVDAQRIDDTWLDGVPMYRIHSSQPASRTFWIDKTTFLVRRIEMQAQLRTGRMEQTIDYHPTINIDIPDQFLAFR